jgi:predicted nuclease with TOPRIM domain
MDARLAESAEQIKQLEGDLAQLNGERDQVRERVERLLQHLDEFVAV